MLVTARAHVYHSALHRIAFILREIYVVIFCCCGVVLPPPTTTSTHTHSHKNTNRQFTIQQEGIRRQEAEYVVSKLRKKVAELQFLLDERDQDTSDEDEDYSD